MDLFHQGDIRENSGLVSVSIYRELRALQETESDPIKNDIDYVNQFKQIEE
jgi:hypothetical protein